MVGALSALEVSMVADGRESPCGFVTRSSIGVDSVTPLLELRLGLGSVTGLYAEERGVEDREDTASSSREGRLNERNS